MFDVHDARTHLALEVSTEFLEGAPQDEIPCRLRDRNVAGLLIANPRRIVLVGRNGATVRRRWW